MTLSKRAFDLLLVAVLAPFVVPLILVIALLVLLRDGRPVFYLSERMKTAEAGFTLLKFRTMQPAQTRSGVTGADKAGAITATGGLLRKYRLDELPQLWNVLRGDLELCRAAPALARVCRPRPGALPRGAGVPPRHHRSRDPLFSRP